MSVKRVQRRQKLAVTITRKMFQMKKPGRLEARHDVENAGCLCLELWYALLVTRFHVSMWLWSFHSCSSTKDCTLMLEISLWSSSKSNSDSERSDVIVSVKSYTKRRRRNLRVERRGVPVPPRFGLRGTVPPFKNRQKVSVVHWTNQTKRLMTKKLKRKPLRIVQSP